MTHNKNFHVLAFLKIIKIILWIKNGGKPPLN
jgi:hypothetical protein